MGSYGVLPALWAPIEKAQEYLTAYAHQSFFEDGLENGMHYSSPVTAPNDQSADSGEVEGAWRATINNWNYFHSFGSAQFSGDLNVFVWYGYVNTILSLPFHGTCFVVPRPRTAYTCIAQVALADGADVGETVQRCRFECPREL